MNETKIQIKKAQSFTNYIIRCLKYSYSAGDLEKGFTKIIGDRIEGFLFYRRPENKMIINVFSKEDLLFGFNDDIKKDIPDIMFFV